MPKPYFKVIQTWHPQEAVARTEHEQKLNNYLKYGLNYSGAEISSLKELPAELTLNKEVHSQSTSTTVKGHNFIITTTLCCEDEAYEEE